MTFSCVLHVDRHVTGPGLWRLRAEVHAGFADGRIPQHRELGRPGQPLRPGAIVVRAGLPADTGKACAIHSRTPLYVNVTLTHTAQSSGVQLE